MMMRNAAVCLALLWSVGLGHAQSSPPASTAAGVFTEEQAKRGGAAYDANCATCHGPELRSADREVPRLSDKAFTFSWVGKTIAEKFELIRSTMPPKQEKSLDDQVYLDILTYILSFNKIPSGKTALKPDPKILEKIEIAAP